MYHRLLMLERRQFLKVAGLAALAPGACVTRALVSRGEWVNDVHAQLNATRVSAIYTPRSVEELAAIIGRSRGPLALSGSRHAMGGQQFASDAPLIDMRQMDGVLSLDSNRGLVDVEAGIQWPALMSWLSATQERWGISQKQTGADRLTLGGSLAANAHGRGLTMKPIVGDVESFTLIDAGGNRLECSRTSNRELFALAIGGYGLFGVVSSIRLRLTPRRKVQRVVDVQAVEGIVDAFHRRISDGYLYGDFQFSIDERSENFLRRGVFSCYRPVADDTPMPAQQAELAPEDWMRLLYLSHSDRNRVYEQYVGYYLASSGQIYWSDEHQLSYYPENYHRTIDQLSAASTPGTEMITELYVPRPRLADFMNAAAEDLRRRAVPVIYGTVRLIEHDNETLLAWAKQNYACIIFNLHTEHTPAGIQRAADAFRALIDLAIARDGSYFLTYHRWARRDQVEAAYPQFAEFLRRKRHYDPDARFQSEWYRHYSTMFETTSTS